MIGIEIYTSAGKLYPKTERVEPWTEYRFRVRARNGEIIAQSEGYTTREAAEKGIRALRRALLPGTRDAEVLAKAWDEGADAWERHMLEAQPLVNPYRSEVPPNG